MIKKILLTILVIQIPFVSLLAPNYQSIGRRQARETKVLAAEALAKLILYHAYIESLEGSYEPNKNPEDILKDFYKAWNESSDQKITTEEQKCHFIDFLNKLIRTLRIHDIKFNVTNVSPGKKEVADVVHQMAMLIKFAINIYLTASKPCKEKENPLQTPCFSPEPIT